MLDEALRIAGRLLPDAGPVGRYEAIAQEYLGEFPDEGLDIPVESVSDGSVSSPFDRLRASGIGNPGSFRRTGLRAELDELRAAALEGGTIAGRTCGKQRLLRAPPSSRSRAPALPDGEG